MKKDVLFHIELPIQDGYFSETFDSFANHLTLFVQQMNFWENGNFDNRVCMLVKTVLSLPFSPESNKIPPLSQVSSTVSVPSQRSWCLTRYKVCPFTCSLPFFFISRVIQF